MGTASVSTGSKSVMTINLNRVVQDATRKFLEEKENYKIENGKQYFGSNIGENKVNGVCLTCSKRVAVHLFVIRIEELRLDEWRFVTKRHSLSRSGKRHCCKN